MYGESVNVPIIKNYKVKHYCINHTLYLSQKIWKEKKKKKWGGEVFMLWCFIPYQHLPLHLRKEHQPSSLSGPHCSKIPSKRQMTGSQTFLKPVRANTCKPTVRAGNLLEVCAGWEHQAAVPHQQMQRAAISYASAGPCTALGSSRTACCRHPVLRWQKMGLMLLHCILYSSNYPGKQKSYLFSPQ